MPVCASGSPHVILRDFVFVQDKCWLGLLSKDKISITRLDDIFK